MYRVSTGQLGVDRSSRWIAGPYAPPAPAVAGLAGALGPFNKNYHMTIDPLVGLTQWFSVNRVKYRLVAHRTNVRLSDTYLQHVVQRHKELVHPAWPRRTLSTPFQALPRRSSVALRCSTYAYVRAERRSYVPCWLVAASR